MESAQQPDPGHKWFLSPAADLLFLANWTWPVLAYLLVRLDRASLTVGAKLSALYLLYLVSTPHRWITLGLVAVDKQRLEKRGPTLLRVGAATCLGFLIIWRWTRSVALLVLIQYLWNVWHVVAQHVGVARIYGIRARPEVKTSGLWEKYLLRTIAFYATWRTLSLGFADYAADRFAAGVLGRFSLVTGRYDALLLAVPAALLWREARRFDRRLLGKYLYLTSVCAHYGAMIFFCHQDMPIWALAVAMTNGVFHAVEYFTIVTWSVRPRTDRESAWYAPPLIRHWASTLLIFILSVATLGLVVTARNAQAWIIVNALISYLHYAFDGVIWKMPDVIAAPVPAAAATA